MTDFERWMAGTQERMEVALARCLPPSGQLPARLHDAMRYAVLGGGKRVRPLLVFAAGELVDARAASLEAPACAVELVHAYSLVHDDLPCMDDDVLRRGKPTVHVEFDYATALLAGDALQTQAFEVLAGAADLDDAQRLRMVAALARAAGSRGMCGGQQIDLDAVGRILSEPELEMMHIHKTGALIRAAVHMGTLAGTPLGAADAGRVDHFAKLAGLLFQVVDDILDATTDTATLGKTAGKDQAADKPTYVSILGLAAARAKARDLLEAALDAVSAFGARAARLTALAEFIARRSF